MKISATILPVAAVALAACAAGPRPTPASPQPAPVEPHEPAPVATVAQPQAPRSEPAVVAAPEPEQDVKVERLGRRDESTEAKGSVAQLRQRVLASQRTWQAALQKRGGAYAYVTGFRSWVGFGHERRVAVAAGKVVEHTYLAFDRDGKTTETWIERGASVGSHAGGSPPPTMDQLYEECLNDVLTKDPGQHAFYVAFFADGLLADCSYRHKQCADDCSEGPEIHAILWQ